jgi:hypothetical protein
MRLYELIPCFPFSGGLDDALNNIIHMCTEQDVPFVFALGRRALGRACAKLVPVSVAGVFNYEGSEVGIKSLGCFLLIRLNTIQIMDGLESDMDF